MTKISFGQAPTFELTFGGAGSQICFSHYEDSDSSVFMLGVEMQGPLGGTDFMLAKVTGQGSVTWIKHYGTPFDDSGLSILKRSDGLFLFGTTEDPSLQTQVLCIKVDTSGTELNRYEYGTLASQSIRKAVAAPDGGFLLVGYENSSGSNYSYVLRLDSLMTEQFSASYSGAVNEYACGGYVKNENEIYVTSDRNLNLGGGVMDYDLSMALLDSSGSTLWDSTYHEDFQNGGQGLVHGSNGRLYFYGETEIYQFSPYDFFITAVDSNGQKLWRQTFGGVGTNAIFDLFRNPDDGSFVGTGYSNSLGGGTTPINVAVIKTDSVGNLIWQREYGFSSIDIGYCISTTFNHGFIVSGRATSPIYDEDFYLLKIDSSGMLSSIPGSPIQEFSFEIYPNPADSKCTISGSFNYSRLEVFATDGRLFYSKPVTGNSMVVDVSLWKPGIYLLKVTDQKGFEVIRKLLVNHADH